MIYLGNHAAAVVVRFLFNTVNSAGLPFTLAGGPVVSVYPEGSTGQTTAQITLTVDFDGVTGMHLVEIDTNHVDYPTGQNYHVVLTTGTVDGNDVSGTRLAEFSIQHRFIRSEPPTTAAIAAAVDALGIPAATFALILAEEATLVAEIIAALLAADLAGTPDSPARSVGQALRSLRNRVVDSNGALRVYKENDTTVAWSANVTRTPGKNAVTSVDPD